MGAGHGHKLHFHGHSLVHRAPAHLKILTLLAFMVLVVATPKDWYAAFASYAVAIAAVIVLSRVPPTYMTRQALRLTRLQKWSRQSR